MGLRSAISSARGRRLRLLAALLPLALAACGGGGGHAGGAPGDVLPPASCSVSDQQSWLADYMNEWYFWYRLAPHPAPAGYVSLGAYFNALLYTGADASFPADRWSGYESTASFNRFYGDGATLGYGVAVAGLEALADPALPLYVRHVDPLSDAGVQGVQRGDQVLSLNGTPAATLIANNDFSLLVADREQQQLTLQLRRNGTDRTVVVSAKVFTLTPVVGAAVYLSQGGRRIGYVAVEDMISQAQSGIDAAFASFRSQGVQDAVLDLRYNGGGLVSTGAGLASYVGGNPVAGSTYATLLYNDKLAGRYNQSFPFASPSPLNALALRRVFVLTGARTCSASEQLINGLRGAGISVVTVGDTTCGKPVGFLPADGQCGTTFSVVNFESVNALNQGRYFDGFDATCAVAEDFTVAQGAPTDPLVATAAYYADTGRCAPMAAMRTTVREGVPAVVRRAWQSDQRSDMLGR